MATEIISKVSSLIYGINISVPQISLSAKSFKNGICEALQIDLNDN